MFEHFVLLVELLAFAEFNLVDEAFALGKRLLRQASLIVFAAGKGTVCHGWLRRGAGERRFAITFVGEETAFGPADLGQD